MIKLTDINKNYGEFHALKNISMEFEKGKTTVIIGPSGSGKSTMLRCMNLLEVPESGQLQLGDIKLNFEEKIDKKRIMQIRKKLQWYSKASTYFPI